MGNLTTRQQTVFDWIGAFLQEHGMPPTVREIGAAFGIKSSSVFYLLTVLEKKGYLKRGKLGARSLVITGIEAKKPCPCIEVPIVGRIAAGKPVFAFEDRAGTISVDKNLLRGHEAYALRAEGDSMVGAGILDGDHVVVRKQDTAEDGDIVVALIGNDATLKRLYREKDGVRLEPANRRLKPIRVDSGEFRVQGCVISVVRVMSGCSSKRCSR